MPIYEYKSVSDEESCELCATAFEQLRNLSEPPLTKCPECGAPVEKLISAAAVGLSRSGLNDRAKNAGFHKLERRGKGEYEKKY